MAGDRFVLPEGGDEVTTHRESACISVDFFGRVHYLGPPRPSSTGGPGGFPSTRHLTYRYHLALSIIHQQTCYAVPRSEFSSQSFPMALLLHLQLNRKLLP